MEIKTKRTAREIKVEGRILDNKNINVKIGTVENRDFPDTIYIFMSFWAKPVDGLLGEHQDVLRKVLNNGLNSVFKNEIKSFLKDNKHFTNEKENIYIKNIPENINYNNKRNFISLELYLHTLNVHEDKKLPLSSKKNTGIFEDAVKIVNIIGNSKLLSSGSEFEIFKKSM